MPLLAYIPVLVLLAGWIYQMGRLIKALEGVEKIAAHPPRRYPRANEGPD